MSKATELFDTLTNFAFVGVLIAIAVILFIKPPLPWDTLLFFGTAGIFSIAYGLRYLSALRPTCPGVQKSTGWLLVCLGCAGLGTAVGFTLGIDYPHSFAGIHNLSIDTGFNVFIYISGAATVLLLSGIWMIRQARAHERGKPFFSLARPIIEGWKAEYRRAKGVQGPNE